MNNKTNDKPKFTIEDDIIYYNGPDGITYEVIENSSDFIHEKWKVLLLKPVKRKPREWWSVIFNEEDSPPLMAEMRFNSFSEAERWTTGVIKCWPGTYRYEIVKVREVIDE